MDNENKSYIVVISDRAAQMLVAHSRFLAQVSGSAAVNLVKDFELKAKSLELFPKRNPRLVSTHVPSGKYRKLLLGKRYLLVYQIKGNTVHIDAVVDTRRDYEWLL